MKTKDKNKKRNRIIVWSGIATLAVIGGVIAYKKCPSFNKAVNLGKSKLVDMCKSVTKGEENCESKLPDFKTKPRTYKTYNGKNI